MLSNMACSLIEHKRITTTLAKAKELRKFVEPLITKSKTDSTHSRRVVFSNLKSKDATSELFREVAPKVSNRPGGYTRIIKLGTRLGDAAEMCMIELVDYNEIMLQDETSGKTRRGRRRRGGKKGADSTAQATEAKATESKTEEVKAEEPKAEPKTDAKEETPKAEAKAENPKAEKEESKASDEAKAEAPEEPKAEKATSAEDPAAKKTEGESKKDDSTKDETDEKKS